MLTFDALLQTEKKTGRVDEQGTPIYTEQNEFNGSRATQMKQH
jgi:hypothetical protein